jgi:DNA primase catalytic subunit
MYVSTSAWLNPVDLPKIKDTKSPHPILLDHLIVFDIDIPPFSRTNMEKARKASVELLDWVENKHDFERVHLVFSGSKGFHLIFREKDRSLFGIEDPRKREHAVRDARKSLLDEVITAGHPVDKGITADTRRIIRLPGSIHGSTGWKCTIIDEKLLRTPFKKWMKTLPRHPDSITMPRWARAPRKKKKKSKLANKTKPEALEPAPHTSLELSSHVPGQKTEAPLSVGYLNLGGASKKLLKLQ